MTEPGPASRIGRYQLVAPIGAGGMGRVWVALDTAAPGLRLVAVKTALGVEAGTSEEFWATLSDEASLASRIDHPNVCATYELGQEGDVHFLVMEWSDGASLRDVLDAKPGRRIAPELAAVICARTAAGLHAAHELSDEHGHSLGVVHRDVSPQNILMSLRGHVRLADFGVAKARGQQHRPTETGEIKGKLSYMAPEQITSKHIDRRADVFALGCVLYEASLGVRPFHGGDAMATMYKILEAPLLAPRAVDPTFPEGLEKVVFKALAKNPDERYATAEELGTALMEFLSSTRRSYPDKVVAELLDGPLGARLRDRNQKILASAEQLRRGETDPGRLNTPAPPPPNQTLTPEGGVERSITLTSTGARPSGARRAALAAAVAAGVVGIAFWLSRSPGTPQATAPAVSAAPLARAAAPSPPASATDSKPSGDADSKPNAAAPPSASSVNGTPRVTSRGALGRAHPSPPTTPTTGLTAKPSTKTPRPIDRDNPFAKP